MTQADFDIGVKLFGSAKISENAFSDEDGLERCETKNNAARKPACKDCCNDLRCSHCQRTISNMKGYSNLPTRFVVETLYGVKPPYSSPATGNSGFFIAS